MTVLCSKSVFNVNLQDLAYLSGNIDQLLHSAKKIENWLKYHVIMDM
jgi:hypothetical protein